ncbi:unnamed protein product [Soboliphyme baturini]|uniref:Decapping nuclease n=1 Tax=Soboliphyme baturini TaxID=241478 RepID=A0A183IHC9_9BILA|nr:unnamed protein product [Soboliphyme baturini]
MEDDEENFPELFEQIINDYCGTNKLLDEVDGLELTDGRGFLSRVIRFKLKWAGGVQDAPDVPTSLVLKVPNTKLVEQLHSSITKSDGTAKDRRLETSRLWINKLHSTECTVYGLFGQRPPVPVPLCYKHDVGDSDSPGEYDSLVID